MKCVDCNQRPAELPDRNDFPSRRKKVCRECHAARFRGDLKRILEKKPTTGKGGKP